MKPTAVYRWYDADDRLLYVGMSSNVVHRVAQHAFTQPWWGQVARCAVEWFASRPEARAAERTAIAAEGPLHNVRLRSSSVVKEERPDGLTVMVNVRMTKAMVDMVDLYAAQEGRPRAEMLRILIAQAIAACQVSTC